MRIHPLPKLIPLLAALWAAPLVADTNADIEAFVDHLVDEQGFARPQVEAILSQAQNLEELIRPKFERSAERTWTWGRYRKNFLNERRIQNGYAFWRKHADLFKQAEQKYGIPQVVLAAIVGVETNYGRNAGSIRVLDSLYTQAFFMPESERRTRFGRTELASFLSLVNQERIDPLEVKGSYAGAMGQPQFIASSYLNFAVDFDGNGQRDLWHSTADIIGSVANYFAAHGWREGEPVTARLWGVGADHADWVTDENTRPKPPSLKIGQLRAAGIEAPAEFGDDMETSLIGLTNDQGMEYWAGLHNFYVITRYNHSNLYAMAVYQLSQQIKARFEAERQHADSND